ncbi:MAG: hypothetical protein P0116_15700 [Candidatus Nitrosocosmicus sp.]|nr:hypothetical protein [Candidatus Nitrosocosmicus sp.]
MFACILSLIVAPTVNVNQELLILDEIDKIFNNLTPDSIGGKESFDQNNEEIISLDSHNRSK